MWQRYCKGDVPSLMRMAQQQLDPQQVHPEELAEPTEENASRLGPIKVNGFKLEQCCSPSKENNGSPWDQNGNRLHSVD